MKHVKRPKWKDLHKHKLGDYYITTFMTKDYQYELGILTFNFSNELNDGMY